MLGVWHWGSSATAGVSEVGTITPCSGAALPGAVAVGGGSMLQAVAQNSQELPFQLKGSQKGAKQPELSLTPRFSMSHQRAQEEDSLPGKMPLGSWQGQAGGCVWVCA